MEESRPHNERSATFDVIIIGGGIAGSCTAIRLAQLFSSAAATLRRILVVDEKTTSAGIFKVGESLPGESKHILKTLGVFEAVNNDAKQGKHNFCYGNSSAWGSDELHDTSTIFNAYGDGFHLNRSLFDETLIKTAESQHDPFITIIRDSVTKSLLVENDDGEKYWKVSISSNELPIHGNVLVDASGRRCFIRKCFPDLERTAFDKLLAFACLFETDNSQLPDSDHHTLVESCAFGWWYTSLLPNKQRIVGFHTDDDLIKLINKKRKIRQAEEFYEFMRETAPHTTKRINEHSYCPGGKRVMCMPANSESLFRFASYENRWIAIGDSAVSFDPLSSQGMLTALYSAKLGAEAIFFQYFNGKKTRNKEVTVQPLEIFQQYIENTFHKYKSEKRFFYNKEQRWRDEVFWRRRHEDHIE
ncbi:5769_t:CDS:2 [Paraglomus occultum]|uniref:5769_t:CDS:1 n=1 Tax=Paraglomus occultum TaxID=144539 RepID=A0A9N8Z0G9_9GLOM|nr:5769_t:CDS:2 [Paraglomus occultum]